MLKSNRDLALSALENYKKDCDNTDKDALSDIILLMVDGQMKRIMYEWIEVFGEVPDSKVYKKLCELDDKGCIFDK